MSRRLGAAAGVLAAGAAAWLPAASASLLTFADRWSHPAARGLGWLWAWPANAAAFGGSPRASLLVGGAAAAATLLPVCGAGMALRLARRGHRPLYGTSKFCTRREAEASGIVFTRRPVPEGILLGKWGWGPFARYVSLPGEEHVGLWARTRSGKGVSFVIPNLLNWGGSVVAFSVKKDLARDTAGMRAAMGDEVSVFAPATKDRRSHRWNLLGGVPRDGRVGTYDAAQRAMWSIIPKTKATNPHFENAARRAATALAVMLAETPDAECSVSAVSSLAGRADRDKRIKAMIAKARAEGRPYPAKAVDAVIEWLECQEGNGGKDVHSTLVTALGLWDSEVVAAATEASDFDLSEVRRRRTAAYVCAEPTETDRLGPIVSALFKYLVGANTSQEFKDLPEPRHQVLLMMDEFTAPDEIPIMARAGAYLASFGLRVCYVTQSKEAMEAVYGPKLAHSISLNTGAEVIFGGSDWSLCEEFSKRGGRDTVEETSESRAKWFGWMKIGRQTENRTVRPRATVLPQEIHRLSQDYCLVHRPGLPLLKLRKIRWFDDPHFRHMALPMPELPDLRPVVERDGVSTPPPTPKPPTARQPTWSNLP